MPDIIGRNGHTAGIKCRANRRRPNGTRDNYPHAEDGYEELNRLCPSYKTKKKTLKVCVCQKKAVTLRRKVWKL